MALRRGFKTEAQETAREVRAEIGIDELQPLDPWLLADFLDIPVLPLSDFRRDAPKCVETLSGSCQGEFHGMIAVSGRRRVIIHNDHNALTRQRADIAHEIAHALLLHEPQRIEGDSRLEYVDDQEDEAGWLGGTLLVPDSACLRACRHQESVEDAAERLGVSTKLMRWRINTSGARIRVKRERDRRW